MSKTGDQIFLVYFEPKSGLNPEHRELYKQNRFTVVRQLKFSQRDEQSVDMVLFVNGIPVSILELKNSLTGQTHIDAEKQFREDRDPKEPSSGLNGVWSSLQLVMRRSL